MSPMTTPTREQEDDLFAEWMDAACLVWMPAPDVIEPSPGTHLSGSDVRQLIRVAWERAHTAGREQGLREAKEVCERAKANWSLPQLEQTILADQSRNAAQAAGICAAAIEQLRGK